jgi:hypothetical protein
MKRDVLPSNRLVSAVSVRLKKDGRHIDMIRIHGIQREHFQVILLTNKLTIRLDSRSRNCLFFKIFLVLS